MRLDQTGQMLKSQCGFRKDGNNRHALYGKTISIEMSKTKRGPFVDLTSAFDTVSRDGLWKIMANKVKCKQCPGTGASEPKSRPRNQSGKQLKFQI